MSRLFEELDYRETPIGPVSLRRRRVMALDVDVFEIILGDEHLMSSLFTASEIALADLGLAAIEGDHLDVLVGGLGLGYTARAVLQNDRVASLTVIEHLDAVIDWHRSGLLPLGPTLTGDDRCRLVSGDFFRLTASADGYDAGQPGRRFNAILVDIDHAPDFFLNPANASFYTSEGLSALSRRLQPGGVFGLWSNDPPDPAFTAALAEVFRTAVAKPVTFANPLQQNAEVTQTVYLATV
ncbi:spermidine synthase [Alphaproteobacteria bacterium HT1-32]|nr:spermidine synthase [Alphaproteobacteria bacterium HT1-32]